MSIYNSGGVGGREEDAGGEGKKYGGGGKEEEEEERRRKWKRGVDFYSPSRLTPLPTHGPNTVARKR